MMIVTLEYPPHLPPKGLCYHTLQKKWPVSISGLKALGIHPSETRYLSGIPDCVKQPFLLLTGHWCHWQTEQQFFDP